MQHRLTRSALLTATSLLLAACANVGVTSITTREPKPDNCALQIFTTESEIQKPFEVVCLIDSQKKAALGESSIAAAIAAAKPSACACGADGILFVGGGTQSANMFNYGSATAVLKAIRYKTNAEPK